MPITAIHPESESVDLAAVEQLKAEAEASWTAYQHTGLHLARQEISAWLKTWGTEQETLIPPCHG